MNPKGHTHIKTWASIDNTKNPRMLARNYLNRNMNGLQALIDNRNINL